MGFTICTWSKGRRVDEDELKRKGHNGKLERELPCRLVLHSENRAHDNDDDTIYIYIYNHRKLSFITKLTNSLVSSFFHNIIKVKSEEWRRGIYIYIYHGVREKGGGDKNDAVYERFSEQVRRRLRRHRRRLCDGAWTPRRRPQRSSLERQMPSHFAASRPKGINFLPSIFFPN